MKCIPNLLEVISTKLLSESDQNSYELLFINGFDPFDEYQHLNYICFGSTSDFDKIHSNSFFPLERQISKIAKCHKMDDYIIR